MRFPEIVAVAVAAAALLGACGARTELPSSTSGTGGTSSFSTSTVSTASTAGGAIEPCPVGCAMGTTSFPSAVPLVPPDVPSSCATGFEMNNSPDAFTATAISADGAPGGTLDVQIATYLKPDHVHITGVDADGATYALVDLCGLQTANDGDPTDGCSRPPDDTIRQYEVTVKPGTTSLTFDVTGACTPFYLRVLGLCDFTFTAPVAGCAFRPIP